MSEEKSDSDKKFKVKSSIRLLVLVFLIVFVFVWKRDLIFSAFEQLRTMSLGFVALCTICSILYSLLDGLSVSKVSGCKYKNGVRVSLIGAFYKLSTLGSANGPAEILYLSRCGVPASKGTGSVLIRYALHKSAATLWGLFAFFYLVLTKNALVKRYTAFVTLGAVLSFLISIGFVLLCVSNRFSHLLILINDKIFKKNKTQAEKNRAILSQFTEYGKETAKNYRELSFALLANILKFIPQFLLPVLVIRAKVPCNEVQIFALTALAIMLSGVMVSPAGIGTLEYVFSLFFAEFASLSVVATIVFRFFTMVFPFLLAIPILFLAPKTKRESPKV